MLAIAIASTFPRSDPGRNLLHETVIRTMFAVTAAVIVAGGCPQVPHGSNGHECASRPSGSHAPGLSSRCLVAAAADFDLQQLDAIGLRWVDPTIVGSVDPALTAMAI